MTRATRVLRPLWLLLLKRQLPCGLLCSRNGHGSRTCYWQPSNRYSASCNFDHLMKHQTIISTKQLLVAATAFARFPDKTWLASWLAAFVLRPVYDSASCLLLTSLLRYHGTIAKMRDFISILGKWDGCTYFMIPPRAHNSS